MILRILTALQTWFTSYNPPILSRGALAGETWSRQATSNATMPGPERWRLQGRRRLTPTFLSQCRQRSLAAPFDKERMRSPTLRTCVDDFAVDEVAAGATFSAAAQLCGSQFGKYGGTHGLHRRQAMRAVLVRNRMVGTKHFEFQQRAMRTPKSSSDRTCCNAPNSAAKHRQLRF